MSQEAGTHSQSVGPTVRCASRFGSIPAGIYTRGSIWPDKDAVIEDHNATLQRLAPPVRIDKIGPFLGRAEGLSAKILEGGIREARGWRAALRRALHPYEVMAVEAAVAVITGTKLKSMAAGHMGYSTSEVGDLVAAELA